MIALAYYNYKIEKRSFTKAKPWARNKQPNK
jgi:hypothetical protein